jgi:hypothetical protein
MLTYGASNEHVLAAVAHVSASALLHADLGAIVRAGAREAASYQTALLVVCQLSAWT